MAASSKITALSPVGGRLQIKRSRQRAVCKNIKPSAQNEHFERVSLLVRACRQDQSSCARATFENQTAAASVTPTRTPSCVLASNTAVAACRAANNDHKYLLIKQRKIWVTKSTLRDDSQASLPLRVLQAPDASPPYAITTEETPPIQRTRAPTPQESRICSNSFKSRV